MRRFFLGIAAFAVLLGAGYAALPWLVNALVVPRLIDQAGLNALELEIGYPGFESLTISRVHLAAASLELNAHNVELSYSARGLRAQRLDNVQAEAVALTVLASEAGLPATTPTVPDTSPPAPTVGAMLGMVPADRLTVDHLEVAVPSLDFLSRGALALDNASLDAHLTGVRPEIAQDLKLVLEIQRTGTLKMLLQDPDPEQPSSIELIGEPEDAQLAVQGTFAVSGYGLRLLQEVAGIPQGTGRVSGELTTRLPWPLTTLPDWRTLDGSARLEAGWSLTAPSVALRDTVISVEMAQGTFRIQPQGSAEFTADGLNVTGTFSGGAFTYRDGRLSSNDPQLTLIAETPTLSGTADVHTVTVTDSPLAVAFTSLLSVDQETAQLKGELEATLSGSGQALEGTFDFEGDANASRLVERTDLAEYPFQLEGDIALQGDSLTASANLTAGPVAGLPLEVTHNLASAEGALTFSHTQAIEEPLLQKLLPGWQEPYDIESGQMAMHGELAWKDQLSGSIAVHPEAVTAYYDDYTLFNAAGAFTFAIADQTATLLPSKLTIEGIDIGTPVTNVATTVAGTLERLSVGPATADVLGGRASIEPFEYNLETGTAAFSMVLSDLDLSEVLALQGDSVSGNGRLSGAIPVTLQNNTVQIEGGTIGAISPGQIKLSPTLAAGITQPGLDIALEALQNFNFKALGANVDYDREGNMVLGVRLEGSNPDLENGRPVHFNLNISENIPVLLKSLRLQDNFTKTLERRVQQ